MTKHKEWLNMLKETMSQLDFQKNHENEMSPSILLSIKDRMSMLEREIKEEEKRVKKFR